MFGVVAGLAARDDVVFDVTPRIVDSVETVVREGRVRRCRRIEPMAFDCTDLRRRSSAVVAITLSDALEHFVGKFKDEPAFLGASPVRVQ